MTGLIDWAADRARMVLAFIVMSLAAGIFSYLSLPKEGEPDIEIPALFVSVPFPGISAADSEKLLVKPMETELADLDGLKTMQGTAAEGYAGIVLEFEFGWDKTQVVADVRDALNNAEAQFPSGAEQYSINEFNFSEFPIIIVNLSGPVPERAMNRIARELQDKLESMDSVLEAALTGDRDEMLEVIIDPLRLEAYNVTAAELIQVVQNNNQLIAAGEVESDQGAFSVKIPSSFDEAEDIYNLPVKTNGDRVITLGDLAEISLTFEDRTGTARYNGDKTVALQVVKRKGFNLIDTVAAVQMVVDSAHSVWPAELDAVIQIGTSNDQSRQVSSMVSQLESSVLTAIVLVMLVSLAALGPRASLLVGFAIPTSFLLCFALLAIMGISISNIVMFGLILSVGMLVDGAIVVVEYADKKQAEGMGPMRSYVMAAKRMFWPVVSSTATTLCAFLPMLFWPGVPGQFMGMLPVTLIFVLSASLVVALVYLPVMGGVLGRLGQLMTELFHRISQLNFFLHVLLAIPGFMMLSLALERLSLFMRAILGIPAPANTVAQEAAETPPSEGFDPFATMDPLDIWSVMSTFATVFAMAVGGIVVAALVVSLATLFLLSAFALLSRIGINVTRLFRRDHEKKVRFGYHQNLFGWFIRLIVGNPIMPLATMGVVFTFVGSTMIYFSNNNNGVDFFVETEPEQAIVYVLARGNLSLEEKDELVRQAEQIVLAHPGVSSSFAFAGEGSLNANTGGGQAPLDSIGQIQIETIPWELRADRPELDGDIVIAELTEQLAQIPGIRTEIVPLSQGPASAKPVHLRLKGDDWQDLTEAAALARAHFESTPGLTLIEDSRPLPGIDWQIDVDVEKAGQYGADVATVGGMVQLVTRGILLDTMRVDSSDEEIEIRVRLPEEDRILATLDTLKVRTQDGLVPLSNFITRTPVPSLAQINRVDQKRFFDVKADVLPGMVKLVDSDDQTIAVLISDPVNGAISDPGKDSYRLVTETNRAVPELQKAYEAGDLRIVSVDSNERIATLTQWLETNPLPNSISWEWTGDQEDQEESQAFLSSAFSAALGLMFIILLAQFNSFYNAVLVLLAVVLSTTGVLWGMLIMDQKFSIIMTGTGIVALAGIVVNNNIVLIDTFQEYARVMPRIEAIIRTAQDRIRPVLLTTITTMAGLAPMMFGLSLNFADGGYTIDSPTALWWKQLATAVVFGLGIATLLTLVFTPSLLAMRVWAATYALWIARLLARLSLGRASRAARDWALQRQIRRAARAEVIWDFQEDLKPIEEIDPTANGSATNY